MKVKTALLALLLVGALAAGTSAQAGFITIGSGATTGVYFPIATGVARMINDANLGYRANARSTGGSVFNIGAIQSGELQMALVQNDIAYYAYRGLVVEAFRGRPTPKLRGMAVLYPEPIHILARSDRNIRSVADFKGKRVYVGDVGSGAEQNSMQVLEAFGLKVDDLAEPVRGSATAGAQLLQDGRIDGMFYTVGLGNAAITQAALTAPVTFLGLEPARIAQLRQKYPFLTAFTIPAGAYRGVNAPVATVTVLAQLATSTDIDTSTVYNVMRLLFDEKLADFKKIHANLERYFDLERSLDGMAIPLHAGAQLFYREKRIPIPAGIEAR
ncbi:MAG: TAXI family TRAP transporter solute-binding subunit [Armatimonadota bacterium]|nr:TAXI family TRAP transporter solute-binding subunit [Armatimonadota bacterium]